MRNSSKQQRRRFVATLPTVRWQAIISASRTLKEESAAALVCPQCQATAYVNQAGLEFLLAVVDSAGPLPRCSFCQVPVQLIPLGADLPPSAPGSPTLRERRGCSCAEQIE